MIADAIRQSGWQPADLRRLVLTHSHGDHIGAAAALEAAARNLPADTGQHARDAPGNRP